MTETIALETAQLHLAEMIARLLPGEEVILTQGEQPVAKLVRQAPAPRKRRQAGSARGQIKMSADFNDPLPDFAEYQP